MVATKSFSQQSGALLTFAFACVISGCALQPPASDLIATQQIVYREQVNHHSVTIALPAGGREFFPAHYGPIAAGRTEMPTFDATAIFTREYGKSSMGSEFGAFRIMLQLVNIPARLPAAQTNIDQLQELLLEGSMSHLKVDQVQMGAVVWLHQDAPNALFGHAQLYTRRLDENVLITVNFSLDRALLADSSWRHAREQDIDNVLRSVRLERIE